MELRAGYKQTEVGVIPEDWRVVPLACLASAAKNAIVGGPFGSDLVSTDYVASGVPVVRGQNMGQAYISGDFVFVSKAKAKSLSANLARPGDLIFTQRGTLGQVSIVPSTPFSEYVVSQSQMKIALSSEVADRQYIFQYFCSTAGQKQIVESAIQTGVPHTNLGILKGYKVTLPASLEEQRTIATALSDVDALLTKMDQLIAKKRDLKQAAMQQLLTGQTRLPGFSGEWEVKRLGDLFAFSGGHTASRDQLSNSGYCYLHYGDIHKSTKTYIDLEAEYLDIPKLTVRLSDVTTSAMLKDGDVVFVDASEDDDGTSRHVVVVNPLEKPFISGLHTIVAKAKGDLLDNGFKRFCFQTKSIKRQFQFFAVGTKVSGISKTSIAKIELKFPPTAEQTAIATVLSDMDAELAALEARRDKTRALKQGMMQALLTGRIRLAEGI